MVNPYLVKLAFNLFWSKHNKYPVTMYTVLECRAYDNVHNIFVRPPIFHVRKYPRTLICWTLACSMLPWESNFEKKHFSNNAFWVKEICYCKKMGNLIWRKVFLTGAQHRASLVISCSKTPVFLFIWANIPFYILTICLWFKTKAHFGFCHQVFLKLSRVKGNRHKKTYFRDRLFHFQIFETHGNL